jgi:CheY-like chemotaxis protein
MTPPDAGVVPEANLVILDVAMPRMPGLQAAAELHSGGPISGS